jgi:hypothetical protein
MAGMREGMREGIMGVMQLDGVEPQLSWKWRERSRKICGRLWQGLVPLLSVPPQAIQDRLRRVKSASLSFVFGVLPPHLPCWTTKGDTKHFSRASAQMGMPKVLANGLGVAVQVVLVAMMAVVSAWVCMFTQTFKGGGQRVAILSSIRFSWLLVLVRAEEGKWLQKANGLAGRGVGVTRPSPTWTQCACLCGSLLALMLSP